MPLFRQFFLLVFARIGPQDMPPGWRPVAVGFGAFLLVGILVAQAGGGNDGAATVGTHDHVGIAGNFLMILLDASVLTVYTQIWLWGRRKQARLPQALTALFGVRAVLGLLTWPLVALVPDTLGTHAAGSAPTGWDWLFLGLFFWNLFALGQIYRHALAVGPGTGMLVSLGYFIASTAITFWLAPELLPVMSAGG